MPNIKKQTKIKTASGTQASGKRKSVSNVGTIDVKNPIPFEYNGTAFNYVGINPYLPFLAPNDSFGSLLLEARLLSNTNNGCVNTKRDITAGQGFMNTEGTQFPTAVQDWFDHINRDSDTVADANRKILESHFTWGNTPVEIAKVTVGNKRMLFVYPRNFLEFRKLKPESDGVVRQCVYSKLFLRKNGLLTVDDVKNQTLVRTFNLYSPDNINKDNWIKDEFGTERTIIWYKNPVSGFDHYGLPSNISSLLYQMLEYKGGRYDLDNFENNMVAGAILALKGNVGDEEAKKIGKDINNTYTGDGKRGRTIVVSSEEGITGSEYHPFDTRKDGSFTDSSQQWASKIIFANNWDEVLAGFQLPKSMGKGSGFLSKIFEIKDKTVIKPQQSDLIQKVWKHIFAIAKEWMGIDIDYKKIAVFTQSPISSLTDVDVSPAVKVDEVRLYNGMPKMEDKELGGMLLGKLKGQQQNNLEPDNKPGE